MSTMVVANFINLFLVLKFGTSYKNEFSSEAEVESNGGWDSGEFLGLYS